MNVISKSMAVCGALFLGAVAAHAQYFKIYQKSGHAVSFYAEEVDSVTTGERYGDFYHRVFLRGNEGKTKDYFLYVTGFDKRFFKEFLSGWSVVEQIVRKGYNCLKHIILDKVLSYF